MDDYEIRRLFINKSMGEITREDIREISDTYQRQVIKEMRVQWLHQKRMETKKEHNKNVKMIREAKYVMNGLCRLYGKQKIFKWGLKHYDQNQEYLKKRRRKK